MLSQAPESFESVFLEVQSYLGAGTPQYTQFLTLVQRILFSNDSLHDGDQDILDLADILKAHPRTFYQLNGIFRPLAHVEFNVRHSPLTSFVLKKSNSSRVIVLSGSDDHLSLHTLSAIQFGDILVNGKSGNYVRNDLEVIADDALQDCLAQLAQDLLDDLSTPKSVRKQALAFLRCGLGVPPSLLLHKLTQHNEFALTVLSDLYEGTIGNLKVIIKKPRVSKRSLKNKEIIREIILCRHLRHPNILPFQGASFDAQGQLYGLVTRFMKNGNVIDFLKHHPNINRLTPVWQIMNGLRFLHNSDPPVAHRDIKGANILVDDNFVCCLSDFGLSSIPELSQRSRERAVGTFSWMGPEMLLSPLGQVDLFKSDLYALAITVIEIYTGEPPSALHGYASRCPVHIPTREQLSLILADTYSLPFHLSELTSMMLDHDPSQRPNIGVVCLAVEDNLEFPRRIRIGGCVQDSSPQTPDILGDVFVKPIARKWIEEELMRERKLAKESKWRYTAPQRIDIPRAREEAPSLQTSRHTRPPSRLALLRRATAHRPTSALSNHEGFHGMPTPITDDSRPPSAVLPVVLSVPVPLGSSDRSSHLTQTRAPHSTIKAPQPRRPSTGYVLYPRDPTRLIIPTGNSPKPRALIIPTQPVHSDSEDSSDPPSSATTPKRSRWSFSENEDEGRRGPVIPAALQRFYQDQLVGGTRSPSPSKRRRHEGSAPSSPIALSSRIADTGVSSH